MATARVGRPCRLGSIHRSIHSAIPPLLVKFDVQILRLICNYFEHHPRERSKCSNDTAATVSAAIIATIAVIANDIGSQEQWQWWGQAIEAAARAHNNQPTDGSDSDKNGICGGGSGNGGMAAMTATAVAQTVAAATAAREIYIKKGRKLTSWRQWRQRWREPLQPQRRWRLRLQR